MASRLVIALTLGLHLFQAVFAQTYDELYRPQYHFTPAVNWMNDPNGLLYYNGIYHLYYQYNPGGNAWGAMSWGHATSTDLTHWNHQPIALLARGYPGDITEMFFSGSAIADTQNTSGFGTSGKVPFVAMYTSYYPVSQNLPSGKSVNGGQQAQSIAYSLDEGMTWTTYDAANPVILNPPTPYADQWRDFRDPFLFWHEASQKWISVVSLAQLHKLLIFTSPNLKDWTYASEFGPWNAVGGVWECPSLFPLAVDGDDANTKWVMQIGINPGGPPGVTGSGTQYIVGTFDGIEFVADPNSPPSAPTSTWTTNSVSITTSVSATTSASITSTTTTATATATAAGSILFQDFEGGGDFASRGWVATGGLIGAAPAEGSLAGQQSVTGYAGSHLVNTFLSGDSTTGTLTSPTFTISLPYINFLIGGGNALGTECINLKVQGNVVRTATGANAEQLLPTAWNVTDLIGQAAVLEIVDQQTGGWGHVLIDQITFTGNPAGDIVFQDFEGAGDFASRGWVATGGLIGAAPAQGTLAGQQSVTGYAGNQLVNTFLSGDSTTGTLTSPTFTISLPKIRFLIGGGNSPGMECVNLKVQGKVVRTATGANAEQLLPTTWDVTDLIGQAAVFEIVDQQTGGWGHILVDQITFTRSTSTNSLSKRSDSSDTWDFNGTSTFADYGWTATGDFVGKGPAQGTLAGQQVVTGNMGNFVNTFLSGDATTGTLTSPTFTITHKKINFLIGGGNSPGTECINLNVQGQVVRTATGANAEQLIPTTWDVTDLIGQPAVIEIIDLSTTGWGHILIDEISFSNISIEPYGPNWMDYGPDFYAATTFNGLSSTNRIDIAWMNNWQYATAIPTSPWRSMLSVARKLSLKTIDDRPRLIQQPTANWTSLQTTTYSNSFDTVSEGNQLVQPSGKLLDITVAFSDRVAASSSSQFGIILRATSDLAQQTRIGYDFSTKRLFVDRTRSGNVGFDGTFPSTYFAPLVSSSDGRVTMRILLDWSSVEVFGGQGEVTISAQIFPQDNGVDVRLFSGGGSTNGVTIDAKVLDSAYDSSTSSTSLSTSSTSTGASTTISSTSTTSVASTLTTSTRITTSANPTSTAPYDFRPVFHFVPEENWMNEPNGLIKIDSTWHLFFQHNPTGNFWGNLSWGHATSTDLVSWNYKPVAISSANGIQAFTGTSYFDSMNLSGLGTPSNPPYLAFYTGYSPSSGVQDQRLAYSLDQGATWTKYQGNPIISQSQEAPHDITQGLEIRDPKVFYHSLTSRWVMILAHGGQNKVTFWTSTDATHWTWTSDFAASNIVGFPSGVNGWEVPDFFELQIQGTTQSKWVLVVTPAAGSPAGGNGVFALTGSFDGSVFTADAVDPTTLWLDYGRDWDGAMSWENVPASDGRRVLAAVMNSYGANPPTNTWKGMLSFPRTLELKQLNGKLRFLQLPVSELDAVGTSVATITNQTLAPGQTLLSNIHSRSLDIRITLVPAQGSTLSLSVRKGGSQQTVIKYNQSSNQLSVDRNASGNTSYDPAAGGVHTAALQADANGKVQLRVLVDECSIEVYGGQGEVVISDLIFPDISSDGLALSAIQGNVVLESVEVRSISH